MNNLNRLNEWELTDFITDNIQLLRTQLFKEFMELEYDLTKHVHPAAAVPSYRGAINGYLLEKGIDLLTDPSINSVERGHFEEADMNEYKIPANIQLVDLLSFAGSTVTKVIFPASVKRIADNAFFNCSSLTDVVLHEGLKEIGDYVFSGTAIEELIIPKSVEKIGRSAFSEMDSLRKLQVPKKFSRRTFGLDTSKVEITTY